MTRVAPLSKAQKVAALARQRLSRLSDDLVFYNSFNGRFTDSPRAVHEVLQSRRPDLRSVWLGDGDGFPPDVPTVAPGSADYFREVGRARWVIANFMMPAYAPRRGVTYVQTWHGTPLKKIGYDNPRYSRDDRGLRRSARDYAQWDFLVSQNRFSTEIFRRAFRFEGEVLEVGYPRNDVLSSPGRDAIRRAVRAELGIDDDVQVLLYAPTFRDDQKDASGRLAFPLAIDLARMQEALGGRFVVLLRLHHWVSAGLGPLPEQFCRDVSDRRDINELYLASDVLLTDYSSVMFDYAVTGKPIVYFTHDLESYRDAGRGFYFDLEAEAPGPLCRTTEELVSVLQESDRLAEDHAAAYRRFRDTYCYLDDGHAAERVVERLLA
ncbi:MAG: CDP-glycerol glycerophosphotransferase family protein [Actinomycetota bacterium]|nr:CDP-glycerol glycerophosphotransferase family protein [Actinomycetota bacterium]MDP9460293.1 CDP-glycerol glycerophosphotransferase family protein [Actinomycetota bacterium]